jgi:hypothetical protein
MKPEFQLNEIADLYIRKNFERLRDFFRDEPTLDSMRGYTLTFTAAQANKKVSHSLGFQPKDILITSKTGDGTVIFNNSSFTATDLDITISGAVSTSNPTVVRFLVGTIGGIK